MVLVWITLGVVAYLAVGVLAAKISVLGPADDPDTAEFEELLTVALWPALLLAALALRWGD